MALTAGSVPRRPDTGAGLDQLKTFADGGGLKAQATALVDENGDHAGVAGKPVITEFSTVEKEVHLAGNIHAIALGLDGNFQQGEKFGKSDTTGIGTSYVDIAYKVPTTTQPVYAAGAAQKVYVKSTSVNDAAAGTGLQKGILQGIDSSFQYVSEEITLNGTTAVASANDYYVILRWEGTETGSGLAQAGELSFTDLAGTTFYMYVAATDAQSQFCYFAVPPDHKAIILDTRVSFGAGKAGLARLQVRTWTGVTPPFNLRSPWRTVIEYRIAADTTIAEHYEGHPVITGPAEVRLQAKVDSTTGQAWGRFGILVLNTAP